LRFGSLAFSWPDAVRALGQSLPSKPFRKILCQHLLSIADFSSWWSRYQTKQTYLTNQPDQPPDQPAFFIFESFKIHKGAGDQATFEFRQWNHRYRLYR